MKKIVSLLLSFLFVLTGCNVNKTKIKNIDIKNLEYLSNNYITFDVAINPNKFEEVKIYFVIDSEYSLENYGSAIYEYKEKMPDGKFTFSYENYNSGLYYLFAMVKGKNLKQYKSNLVEVDLKRENPTLDIEVVSNFSDNANVKFINVEKDLNHIYYCMVANSSVNSCDNYLEVSDYSTILSINKEEKNFVLFKVNDLIGNEKSFVVDLSIE